MSKIMGILKFIRDEAEVIKRHVKNGVQWSTDEEREASRKWLKKMREEHFQKKRERRIEAAKRLVEKLMR